MRLLIFFICIATLTISCKDNQNIKEKKISEVSEVPQEIVLDEGQQRYEGIFNFSIDTEVLMVNNDFYAVQPDSMMQKLNRVAEALKESEYDAVNVVIHGTEKVNPMFETTGDGWKRMITIKKIIEVTPADNSGVIRTGIESIPYNASK